MNCDLLNKSDINNYGIVYTPDNLVNEILDLIPEKYFKIKDLTWLDIGAGKGAFSLNLYNRLLKNLSNQFENIEQCKKHIIKNMLFMIEIYPLHIEYLKKLFTNESNIINKCFLSLNEYEYKFDFIIGNPPYNINGSIKTPTNNNLKKTDDGKSVYVEFVNKSLNLLYDGGFLNLIIPSLWLKTDKANLYNTLTNLKIHKIKCLCTSDSTKAFKYQAQTPTCFFLIENYDTSEWDYKPIKIYDKIERDFINYSLKPNHPIPINGINILKKLQYYIDSVGSLKFNKTNSPPKKMILSETSGENCKFPNIKTCFLNKLTANIVLNYSNIKSQYCYEKPKLILPHKMYGIPYLDKEGIYGVSTRDNYIISGFDYNIEELEEIQYFLSTKFTLFIFLCCNYRMRFLERAAFIFIPIITKIPNFPKLKNINRENRDKLLYNFFNLSSKEIEFIENNFKNYVFFV